ncbi:MAG TPA: GNA1162 family protein [Steroidobacteraceae bacterium]|nr:GNA1162 family protein [Steroidobacteraceae bacterium]
MTRFPWHLSSRLRIGGCAIICALAAGCATTQPYDYGNFRAHRPRSILILPPLNESTAVEGTYGYLSTVSQPVAELGYYVFPVEVVDQFLKDNGMPTAGEMHQVPLNKVLEITGADAVLFVTLEKYGSQYNVLSSTTIVRVHARLVDTRTQTLLWEGHGEAQQGSSNGSGGLLGAAIAAAISQAINSKTDQAHNVSRLANANMFAAQSRGLPHGPYSPDYNKDP